MLVTMTFAAYVTFLHLNLILRLLMNFVSNLVNVAWKTSVLEVAKALFHLMLVDSIA